MQKYTCEMKRTGLSVPFSSIQDDIKDGKAYVFWNLDAEFQNVAVVNLGKPCKSFNKLEQICEDKETVRAAASGG